MTRQTQFLGFNGSATDTLAVHNPYWTAFALDTPGAALGVNMDTQDPFYYHPFLWAAQNIIPNLIQFNFAKIGHGKTTLIDMINARYSMLKIGDEQETYEIRIWADNIRKLHGEVELKRLATFFESEVVGSDKRINPLDPEYGLNFDERLTTLFDFVVASNENQPLGGHLPYAFRVAADRMYSRYPKTASLDVLRDLMRVQDLSFETDYKDSSSLSGDIDIENLPEELKADLALPSNLNEEEWRRDSFRGYELLDRIIKGDYGNRFGGRMSSAADLRQRAVVNDLSDLPDTAIELMQKLNWRIKLSANARQDRRYMYQIDNHDENWKMLDRPSYETSMYGYLKQIRSFETLVLINSHRPNDYEVSGTGKAAKMPSEAGSTWVGKQEPSDANDIAHRLSLNNVEEKRLLTLQKGQWCVKLGSERAMWIDTTPMFNQMMQDMSESNQALRVLLNAGKHAEQEREREMNESGEQA